MKNLEAFEELNDKNFVINLQNKGCSKMNESIFDVLMYLFENYMIEDIQTNTVKSEIQTELFQLGFTNNEVEDALQWLDTLTNQCSLSEIGVSEAYTKQCVSVRCYTSIEKIYISTEIQGILLVLEQNSIISAEIREIIIDRILSLSKDKLLSDNKAKWVIMVVLSSCQIECDFLLDVAESLVFDDITKH